MGSEQGHPLQSASGQPERRQLFISYSHRDGEWVERLRRMIKPLEQRYGLERWDDSRIQAGGLWRQEIEQALANASVALLLVSADFLASDFVTRSELPPLFRAAKQQGLRILWVPLRPSLWKHIPEIEQYQAVIPPGRTLAEMAEVEQERAFVQIAELILSTFQEQEERLARLREEEAERLASEQKEQQVRLAREQKAEEERLAREQKAEAERVARERQAREREAQDRQAEQERLAREAEERRRQEAERLDVERLAREQEARERQAREQAEHQNRAEVERWKAEAERLDREMKALERRAAPEQAAEELPQPAKNDRQEKLQRYEQEFRPGINATNQVRPPAGPFPRSISGPLIKPFSRPLSRRQLLISVGTGVGVVLGVIAVKKQPKPAKAIPNSTTTWLVRQGDRWEKKTKPIGVQTYREQLPQGVELTMVEISAGSFLMGSPLSEEGRDDDEAQRRVTVPAFRIGRFPITQAQWNVVAGLEKVERELNANPSKFKGPDRPVESVSWPDAIEFCRRLSKHTRRNYTLPSEAQWEYACRAGSTTPFHFGETLTTELANYNGNDTYGQGPKGTYREQTTDVGSFPANAWGLQDMHGNVWEWCLDRDKASTLLRGGSWSYHPANCRSAFCGNSHPGSRSPYIGFRVCCLPQD
ncbi:MAG: SUMF1/EgtB/PvdO family nonheme iron enzyme [Cyanobacteria bacterium]|nr:SUMF1/EgtB/PvdO family nonheme iron enzyme [Cyanobacteriota bacterium]